MSSTNKCLAVNIGVPTLAKLFSLAAILTVSQASFADAELDRMKEEISKEAYVEVITAPSVRQQIGKLTTAEQKQTEAAIKVGVEYMRVYLHGGSSCAVSDYWEAYMGGLTATDDAWDWYNNFCGGLNGFQHQTVRPMACSPVSLVGLQFQEGGVILEYRITRTGGVTWRKEGGPDEFSSQGAGDARRFTVSINANNRIYDIDPRGDPAEIGYVSIIEDAKTYLKDPTFIGLPTPAAQRAGKLRLKQLIGQIERQAEQVCK